MIRRRDYFKRLINVFLRFPPQWFVGISLFVIALILSRIVHTSIEWPSFEQFRFVGLSYLLPFGLLALWLMMPFPFLRRIDLQKGMGLLMRQIGNALCFAFVITLHFYIKLWAPLINPNTYDSIYEAIDHTCFFWLKPLIAWRSHWSHVAWVDSLYLFAFMFMFTMSFVVHNLQDAYKFRRVFLASLLVQALGAISYLIAPAVGPFIYHPGANALITNIQANLYQTRVALLAGGPAWLRQHSGENLTCGLAAMPSLHIAASFVFLYYAYRYSRWLVWIYTPCFLWFCLEAVASRWHYGIDLIAGLALSVLSIVVSNVWMSAHEEVSSEVMNPEFAATAPVLTP